tara:strand:- start:474 stop:944 length:471 start_codon:yes stop_codon:yes gene_type:complete
MRYIYYIPEGESVEDHKEQWHGKTPEVHTGLSPNIESYIKDPTKPQFVEIPEYTFPIVPINAASKDFVSYKYVDDFVDVNNTPQYIMEVWKKNLDNPSDPEVKVSQYFMQYEKVYRYFYTDHIKLETGWYNLVFKKDDKEIDTKEITIYDKHDEEE